MTEALIYLDPDSSLNLQNQIRQKLVDAILIGTFPGGSRLPSSCKLAEQLGVARNTVVLVYEQLIDEGFLESRERSGIYVNKGILEGRIGFHGRSSRQVEMDTHWRKRFCSQTDDKPQFQWPDDWQKHPYPLVSRPRESHPQPLAEPYVTLSCHTAPIIETLRW